MSDPRATPAHGRVAHVSLRGQVEADRFVEGEVHRVTAPVADLCRRPDGPRDRQLVRGEAFRLLDARPGWGFGMAERDGYVGWMALDDLGAQVIAPTHVVVAARSYAKTTGGLKAMGGVTPLSFGTRVTVIAERDRWADIAWEDGPRFVPSGHLAALPHVAADPVAVAELFLGTPYLWGGNSSFGIDCSGLVQAACLACGIAAPGDSDQQEAALGASLPAEAPLRRGDLLFWRGHVAWVADEDRLLHANAHHMAVAFEPIGEAIARIAAQDDGPVTARRRLG